MDPSPQRELRLPVPYHWNVPGHPHPQVNLTFIHLGQYVNVFKIIRSLSGTVKHLPCWNKSLPQRLWNLIHKQALPLWKYTPKKLLLQYWSISICVPCLQSKKSFLPSQYWDSLGCRQFHASMAGVFGVNLCYFVSWKPFLLILFNIYPEIGIYWCIDK